jgi:twitching motility protein PilT
MMFETQRSDAPISKRKMFHIEIQYETLLNEGKYEVPATTFAKDISASGIGFYMKEKIQVGTRLRVSLYVSDDEKIFLNGKIRRIVEVNGETWPFFAGLQFEDISSNEKSKFEKFMSSIDIDKILDLIDFDGVIDLSFSVGYPPIVKKASSFSIVEFPPFDEYTLRTLLLSMLDQHAYRKFIIEKECDFIYPHQSGVRLRVNLYFQRGTVEAMFRVIPPEIRLPSVLGLPVGVESLLQHKRGLILISGRTGSGKSTTMASMVEFINRHRQGIIFTVESPIEYLFNNQKAIIKQREVGKDTNSFYNAAKSALRQNPDVLVVGEIRDMETMDTVLTAAETGTLVIATIHAGDSVQSIDRVASFFPADQHDAIFARLSLTLRGVIAQQLIPRVDSDGAVVACELLLVSDSIKRAIRDKDLKSIPSFIETGRQAGMQSMQMSLDFLYQKGMISPDHVGK